MMLSVLIIFCLTLSGILQAQKLPPDSRLFKSFVDDDDNFTATGNIGLTISNFGTFGDGFVAQVPDDQPSCEFPKGSGIEHIFVGGLWVGAETSAGIRVTTGAFNIPSLRGGANNFEFTNTADPNDLTVERSSLQDNKFFSPEAISHQDFVVDFNDTNLFVPGTSIPVPNHQPLGIGVHLETYAWNFPFADAFVIFNYTITNVSDEPLTNAYVGLWADMVVRNVNVLPPRVGAPFYLDVGVGFLDNDTARMVYAYEPDDGSRYTNADSYVALVYLGAEVPGNDNPYRGEVFYNWWLFSGGEADWERPPADDASRYQRMRESLEPQFYQVIRDRLEMGQPGNYMSFISTGPFESIAPDASINVVFAVACGRKFGNRPPSIDDDLAKKNLYDNIGWAQRAYRGEDSNRNGILDYVGTDSTEDVIPNGILDRYILPTPPSPPRFKAIPENGKVTLLWDRTSEESIDFISKVRDFEGFRLYRSFTGSDISATGIFDNMQLVGEFDLRDGIFYDTGLEKIQLPEPIVEITTDAATGEPDTIEYYYRLEIDGLNNGWQYAFAVSAFDSGDASLNLPSLESSRLQNVVVVSPGTPARKPTENIKVGVYPNPYRVNALWDGGFERERRLHFYNLPSHSEVRIYTLAGDLVDSFVHDGGSYTGEDIQWYQNFSQGNTVFPGGEHAWDLVTSSDQAIATGLYLFTVKDLDSGEVQQGKFVVIK